MEKKSLIRAAGLSAMFAALSFSNFSRIPGAENVHPIQMVSLLTCGMGIGILVFSGVMLWRQRRD